jgi:Stress responsive A/B Barrel Domain
MPDSPRIAHMVYFTLKDGARANQQKLVEACHRLLEPIPGIEFFGVGTLVADLARPVNVRDFHVGLHVVFSNRKAHDEYQVDARHQRFIAENKETWQQIRVFDCELG